MLLLQVLSWCDVVVVFWNVVFGVVILCLGFHTI